MKTEKLQTRVFDSAMEIVQKEGMSQLNVRKVAKLTGCSLGSIYNAFKDFPTLQLHINSKVLSDLFTEIRIVVENGVKEKKSLFEIFKTLGMAYLEFGEKNKLLWKSVFEHFPIDPIPEWYKKSAREGVYQISDTLASYAKLDKKLMRHKVGFFWASIHGKSAILLNRKMEAVAELFDTDSLDSYIEYSLQGLFSSDHLQAYTKDKTPV